MILSNLYQFMNLRLEPCRQGQLTVSTYMQCHISQMDTMKDDQDML